MQLKNDSSNSEVAEGQSYQVFLFKRD